MVKVLVAKLHEATSRLGRVEGLSLLVTLPVAKPHPSRTSWTEVTAIDRYGPIGGQEAILGS